MCFVCSDALSFNSLHRGQFEYLSKNGFDLTLICGGAPENLSKLRERKVGKGVDLKIVRQPSIVKDSIALVRLFIHFMKYRYDVILVTTPKAILLGSIAGFLAFQPRRI